jgi:hypothetical protein
LPPVSVTLAGDLGAPKTLNKKQGDDFSCQAITPAGPSVATAHRGDGKRFVLRADEKLTAFMELELAVCACGELT